MPLSPIIITRSGKGSPLTNSEVDSNFTNLADDLVYLSVQHEDLYSNFGNHVDEQEIINTNVAGTVSSHETRLDDIEVSLAGVGGTLAGYVKADGTTPFTGNADLGGNKIVSIATPDIASDAANKAYVDTTVADIESSLTTDITNLANIVNSIDLTQYVKKDGTVEMVATLPMGNNRISSLAQPVATEDATPKSYVLERTTFKTESIIEIDSNDCVSGELVPSTYAYEITGAEVCDKIVFDNNLDSDTINFPNKSYKAKIRYLENYTSFSDGIVNNTIVNRSVGKLVIDVETDLGVKLCSIPPKSFATIEWKGNTADPVWLITITKQEELIKPAVSFTKAIVAINADGTVKANHTWVGKDYLGGNAISFTINHIVGSGIYDISWVNTNSHLSNVIDSPIVIPTLILTSSDTGQYNIYAKDVTTSGCSIHIRDNNTYVDLPFSIIVGGHNTSDGSYYDNPFLV